MQFTENDRVCDSKDIHIVGVHSSNPKKVIAVCILHDKGENVYKTRQVAVAEEYQKKGIGSKMIKFSEETAKKMGAVKLTANARKYAKGFYEKLGYEIGTEDFSEVGIPHVKASKNL